MSRRGNSTADEEVQLNPPTGGWIERTDLTSAQDGLVRVEEDRRWVIRVGQVIVMWGEGTLVMSFDKMESHGFDTDGYVAVQGQRVGMTPDVEYQIETAGGNKIGTSTGNVAYREPATIDSHVKATRITEIKGEE